MKFYVHLRSAKVEEYDGDYEYVLNDDHSLTIHDDGTGYVKLDADEWSYINSPGRLMVENPVAMLADTFQLDITRVAEELDAAGLSVINRWRLGDLSATERSFKNASLMHSDAQIEQLAKDLDL